MDDAISEFNKVLVDPENKTAKITSTLFQRISLPQKKKIQVAQTSRASKEEGRQWRKRHPNFRKKCSKAMVLRLLKRSS